MTKFSLLISVLLLLIGVTLWGCNVSPNPANTIPPIDDDIPADPGDEEPESKVNVLPEVEATEFNGEELTPIANQGNYAVEGTQYIERDAYRLLVRGLVNDPKLLTYDEILSLEPVEEVAVMPCVDGWQFKAKWTGSRVMDIIDLAGGIAEGGVYVLFHCNGGTYSSGQSVEYLQENDIIMAYGLNDVTLPQNRGFPFQLVSKEKYGYKWPKWITEIEVLDDVERGYWESRGYSETGWSDEPGWEGVITNPPVL